MGVLLKLTQLLQHLVALVQHEEADVLQVEHALLAQLQKQNGATDLWLETNAEGVSSRTGGMPQWAPRAFFLNF